MSHGRREGGGRVKEASKIRGSGAESTDGGPPGRGQGWPVQRLVGRGHEDHLSWWPTS